jgi:hypothetical protein
MSIDTQNFAPYNVAPSLGKLGASNPVSKELAGKAMREAKSDSRMATAKEVAALNNQTTSTDKTIKGLKRVSFLGDVPFQWHFIGGAVGGLAAGAAARAGKLNLYTKIKSFTVGWVDALSQTKIKDFRHYPANYKAEVAKHAKAAKFFKEARASVPKAEFSWNPIKWFNNVDERKKAIKSYVESASCEKYDAAMAEVSALKEAALQKSGARAGEKIITQVNKVATPIGNGLKRSIAAIDNTAGIGKGLENLTHKLPSWKWLDGMRGKNLSGLASSLKRSVGGMSLFAGIVAVGTTAAVGATLLASKKENRAAKNTIKDIEADIGADHPIAVNIRKSYASKKTNRALGTAANVGGDVLNGVMFSSLHGMAGGYGAMAVQMSLPMVGKMLVSESPVLNSYANLKLADAGQAVLPADQKVEAVRQLVATVPSVATHGGYYNKLAAPVAEAIVAKNLSTRETMKLIANEAQFMALATEVADKQKAAAAVVADAAPVADKPAIKPMQHEAHYEAGKPQMAIHAKDAHHQGTVATQQKAVSA